VFLVERYSYGTDGELLGAIAVPGITSLPPDQADLATCWLTCAATPAAVSRPHHATGAERKPCRDLTALSVKRHLAGWPQGTLRRLARKPSHDSANTIRYQAGNEAPL
jgi:hypothetical protein